MTAGVSVIVPVHDGERWLDEVLHALLVQELDRPLEVIVIDDGSTDSSRDVIDRFAHDARILILDGHGRGAAAALNLGIEHARYDLIAQVDQDVIVRAGWVRKLLAELKVAEVGAAQGQYRTTRSAPILERVMGRDLEDRYARIRGRDVDHVCTGNTVYRASALADVGPFDEQMGYGYDVDMSYRLKAAGHRLVLRRDAKATHRWRSGLFAYLRQQYGYGYGRLDVLRKHRRMRGDDVARTSMLLHAPAMTAVLLCLVIAAALAIFGVSYVVPLAIASGLLSLLILERVVAMFRARLRTPDPAVLLFVPIHLLRDVAWSGAVVVWLLRQLRGRPSRPADTMPRTGRGAAAPAPVQPLTRRSRRSDR